MAERSASIKAGNAFLFLLAFGLGVFSSWMLVPGVFAQSSGMNSPGILMGATDQGFRFMSGGVGLEERRIMESWGADYNLRLAFAEASGDYLSGVKVVVEDQDGKELISTTTNGPWLYVKLPAGKYDVKATVNGKMTGINDLQLSEGHRVSRILSWDLS